MHKINKSTHDCCGQFIQQAKKLIKCQSNKVLFRNKMLVCPKTLVKLTANIETDRYYIDKLMKPRQSFHSKLLPARKRILFEVEHTQWFVGWVEYWMKEHEQKVFVCFRLIYSEDDSSQITYIYRFLKWYLLVWDGKAMTWTIFECKRIDKKFEMIKSLPNCYKHKSLPSFDES